MTGSATPKMAGPGVESRATALDGPGRPRAPRGEPLAWRGDAFGARARCREQSAMVWNRGGVIGCGMAPLLVFGPVGLRAPSRSGPRITGVDPRDLRTESVCGPVGLSGVVRGERDQLRIG